MLTTKKLVSLLTAMIMLLSVGCCFAEESEVVLLMGAGEVLGMDGATVQPTAAALALDLTNGKAELELTTETMGMDFFLLASEKIDNPELEILYMMCAIIGEGTITETEGGYLVTFAWENVSMDEATGATVTTPMTLEIAVKVTEGVYTATVDYYGVVVELSSEVEASDAA